MRQLKWFLVVPAALAALIVGGTFTYVHFIEGDVPGRLSFADSASPPADGGTTTSGFGPAVSSPVIAGTWKVTGGSRAGYRVGETLFGQNAEAVGRTENVTGQMTIDGTTVKAASITVDLTTVTSDQSRRDNQFRGRIMNVATYPTATFELTQPIDLGTLPGDGQQIMVPATGKLTVHGTTKEVKVNLAARRNGSSIEVNGTIPVVFDEWGIPNPSFGPVSTDDHGEIEFLVAFTRA